MNDDPILRERILRIRKLRAFTRRLEIESQMKRQCSNCGNVIEPEDFRLQVKGGIVCSIPCRTEFERDLAQAKGVPVQMVHTGEEEP